jgi:hypothetical protein
VTISFGFSSLKVAIIAGVLEELPYVGFALALLFFHFHRTLLVTDRHVMCFGICRCIDLASDSVGIRSVRAPRRAFARGPPSPTAVWCGTARCSRGE